MTTDDRKSYSPWGFDPEIAFLRLRVVKVSLSFVAILSVGIGATILWNEQPQVFDFSAGGFAKIASMLRVPIGLLAASIPFFALMAANHRSEQTKQQMDLTRRQITRTDTQIRLANEQNIFSNYFKHIEEFSKYCDLQRFDGENSVLTPRQLHLRFYPHARTGDLTTSQLEVDKLATHALDFISRFAELGNSNTWQEFANMIYRDGRWLDQEYFLRPSSRGGSQQAFAGEPFLLLGGSLQEFARIHIEQFRRLDILFAFDAHYRRPEALQRLLNAKLGSIEGQSIEEVGHRPFSVAEVLSIR